MTVAHPAPSGDPTNATEPSAGERRRTGKGHVDSYGPGRVCVAPECSTELSRYNDASVCWRHREFRSGLASRFSR